LWRCAGVLDARELEQVVSFLGQSATAKVFETAGINMDTIMMAIKLADLDGDNNVSYGEFIQAMHTLHDATQKQDMWLLQLKMRDQAKTMEAQAHEISELKGNIQEMSAVLQRQTVLLEALVGGKKRANGMSSPLLSPLHSDPSSGWHTALEDPHPRRELPPIQAQGPAGPSGL